MPMLTPANRAVAIANRLRQQVQEIELHLQAPQKGQGAAVPAAHVQALADVRNAIDAQADHLLKWATTERDRLERKVERKAAILAERKAEVERVRKTGRIAFSAENRPPDTRPDAIERAWRSEAFAANRRGR